MAALTAPPVYSFFGHSCSTGDVYEVPDGCILVTLALCGDVTYADKNTPFDKFEVIFQDPAYTGILADPVKNKALIQRLIGASININYPGAPRPENRRYMDTLYSAQLSHFYEAGTRIPGNLYPNDLRAKYDIHRSGLYRAGTTSHLSHLLFVENAAPHEDLEYMYPDGVVLYPMHKNIEKYYNTLPDYVNLFEKIGEKFQIHQSTLFAYFPGIHYLVTCRTPCFDSVKAVVHLRRAASRPPENDPMGLHPTGGSRNKYTMRQVIRYHKRYSRKKSKSKNRATV
jgi:hypothetical protein